MMMKELFSRVHNYIEQVHPCCTSNGMWSTYTIKWSMAGRSSLSAFNDGVGDDDCVTYLE